MTVTGGMAAHCADEVSDILLALQAVPMPEVQLTPVVLVDRRGAHTVIGLRIDGRRWALGATQVELLFRCLRADDEQPGAASLTDDLRIALRRAFGRLCEVIGLRNPFAAGCGQ